MTAATQTFHNELHIDFINRPRADINPVMVLRQHKRSLDADDIQQFIRCLCTRHRRALNIVRRAHADSKHIVEHFCMPHGFRSRFVRIHIIPEHLAHSGNLCSAPAQICCCLKSTDTCFGYKIIGINQNSRINSICLLCGKFDIFIKIL